MEPEIRATPRDRRIGLFADALMKLKQWGDRARFNPDLPLVGGQGLGELLLGGAPEEVDNWSYGNSPIRINPYAGQTAGLLPEVKPKRRAGLLDAVSLIGPTLASGVGRGMAMGLMGGGDDVARAATVFHGSPHKFSKFDSSKIGTGEGAQAYGHGLYLAEAPAVAKEYAEKLSSAGLARHTLAQNAGQTDAAIAAAEQSVRNYQALIANGGGGDPRRAQGMLTLAQKKLTDLQAIKAGTLDEAGNLYKVDLPDEQIAKMLDWDKPLSQQAPEVRGAVAPVLDRMKAEALQPAPGWGDIQGAAPDVDALLKQLLKGGPETAAELRKRGIPGIRYLDGGSRGAGTGSSNYVVFPGGEDFLTILERNGLPIPESLKK